MQLRLSFAPTVLAALGLARAWAATDGPDPFGYIWADQHERFVDSSLPAATGPLVELTLTDESLSAVTDFPGTFDFPFYGTRYRSFRISDNGWMTFETTATAPVPTPGPIPGAALPGKTIALFWRDLEPAAIPLGLFFEPVVNGVHFRYVAYLKGTADYVQLHWVLYSSGVIKVWYQFVASPATAAAGIQRDAATGLSAWDRGSSAGGFVLADDAVLMYFPPPALTCASAQPLPCGAPTVGAVTNLAGPNASGWLCASTPYLATEKVFQFDNPDLGNVRFELSNISPATSDLDLFVLARNECNEFRCIAGGSDVVDLPFLAPGRYYVAVDGPTQLDTGTFTLTATCSKRGEVLACQAPGAPPVTGATSGLSTWDSYPACAGSEVLDGPEYVYQVALTSPGNLRASLSNHPGGDVDLLLFPPSGVAPADCMAWGDEEIVVFDPPSGDYYVMVDGKAAYAGPYDIRITCGIQLDCAVPGTPLVCETPMAGTTIGKPNKVDDYSCSPTAFDGGEAVYRWTQASTGTLGLSLEGPPELEMLVVAGTCNEARCIASGRSIVLRDLAPGDYWVVVDAPNGAGGDFTIVPVCSNKLEPASIDTVLAPGQCLPETKTAHVTPTFGAIDVLLIQDATAGQANFISSTLADVANQLIDELSLLTTDLRFGLASLRDYNATYSLCGYSTAYGQSGDWPWRVDQPLTTDRAAMLAAVGNLVGAQGGDYPESYGRAWYEVVEDTTVGWRPNSTKLAIMIGDDVPHECDVGQCLTLVKNTRGVDPGRDGLESTADDVLILEQMDRLAAACIRPIFIYNPQGPRLPTDDLRPVEVHALWDCWTRRANGMALYNLPVNGAEVVRQFLETDSLTCRDLTLAGSPGYETWVKNLTPPSVVDFSAPGRASFQFDLCVPATVPPGVHNFTVDLVCGCRRIAAQQVRLTTSNCTYNAQVAVTGSTCAGSTRTFDASASTIGNCTGGYEYQFRNPDDQVVQAWSGLATYSTRVDVSDTWTVEIRCRDQGQCPGSARHDFPVTVVGGPLVDGGPDVAACVNQTVTLGTAPVPGYTYQWSPTTYMNPPAGNVANPTVTPTSTTPASILYTLTVTETISGCTASDDVVLAVVAGAPTGSVGNELRLVRNGQDVRLEWTTGALSPRLYNVHRTATKSELQLPAPTAPVVAGVGNAETWIDAGAISPAPPFASLLHYQVYGRDCSGNSIFQ